MYEMEGPRVTRPHRPACGAGSPAPGFLVRPGPPPITGTWSRRRFPGSCPRPGFPPRWPLFSG